MKAATAPSAAALAALLSLAGCSGGSTAVGTHAGTGIVANQAPITVTTVSPAPSDSPVTAAPTGSGSDQLSIVESDLAGVDSASAQADTDTGAADSAQATRDSP